MITRYISQTPCINRCWWGYNLTLYYWILEGPRLTVVLLNFLFLLNIVRVLILKLRQSHTSDVEQVRKAVRAAVILVPLLGITNVLNMTEAPLDKTALEFAIWSYVTHLLTSFQGLIIAFLYCFMNGENENRTHTANKITINLKLNIPVKQQPTRIHHLICCKYMPKSDAQKMLSIYNMNLKILLNGVI
ncbi:PDF receptor-like [Wyeomyia smithii]|uniref:PDF receptor-like n=1 Tax=Wyeomyia smithii TaxID=174621 RepID=UPI00246803F3|nr:PDF receptor-like [Wyeomyia smithii]